MGKSKKQLIFLKCEKCGYTPQGDNQGNWVVYKNESCSKCGGKLTLDIDG